MMPHDWTLVIDRPVRRRSAGKLMIGGSPTGILRLSEAGAEVVDRLAAGGPIGARESDRSLAQRLVERGMAHPRPTIDPTLPASRSLVVVVPVKDDPAGLRSTLGGLDLDPAGDPTTPIVVVDDGSSPPIASVPGAAMLRNDRATGPASARNRGIAARDEPLIAFIDAGVVIARTALDALCAHFDDPDVVAVAPRVRSRSATPELPAAASRTRMSRRLSGYEFAASPLDLGPRPANVAPGAPVSYVPSACLVVRRSALRAVGPFDPSLRYGEDVDLVWRLCETGSIRYDPTIVATHPHRDTIGELARQRFGYGSSAAALAERHGSATAPLRASRVTYVVMALLFGGHPLAALAIHGASTLTLARKLGAVPDAAIEAIRFTTAGNGWALRTTARNALRVWWPFTVGALALGPTRRVGGRLAIASLAVRMIDRHTARPADSTTPEPGDVPDRISWPAWFALSLIDDLSYGTGVVAGALDNRSSVALRPTTGARRLQSTSGSPTIRSSRATTSSASMPR